MDQATTFGRWLRERRKALDLTQEAFAERMNCSVSYVRKWEAGIRRPSPEYARELAQSLGLEPEERTQFLRLARSPLPAGDAVETGAEAAHAPWAPRPRPSNLPAQTTLLFGRERELEEVRALLRREGVRLLTLTGPGGVGKTRLGVEAAAGLLGDFEDGVCFVPLGAVAEAEQVAAHLAHHLGVKVAGARAAGGASQGVPAPEAAAARA